MVELTDFFNFEYVLCKKWKINGFDIGESCYRKEIKCL